MRIRPTLIALLLTTGLAQAQAVSPLGGSTNNAGSPPPALAAPSRPTTVVAPVAPASPATTPASPAPAATTHARRTMDERFAVANTTKDGKLTLDQAKAGHLRAVARDFAMIDKNKRGYVTLDEIKAHQSEQRAARKAARDAKKQ
ncbi:MAG: hypothetical protein ACRYG8_27500 [Janthinobacterium lividum]